MKISSFNSAFVGLRRSGNHAVLDWLLAHHNNWIHYNNVVLEDLTTDQVVHHGKDPDYVVASFEDYDLRAISERIGNRERIVLLRDPFNLFASRLAMVRKFVSDPECKFTCLDLISRRAINLWKQYAREFIYAHVANTVFINFNLWYEDQEYRKDISRVMGWEHTDAGFASHQGWQFSGGSSFSGGNPLESWKNLRDDDEYLSMFDEETVFLSETMYGTKPPLRLKYRADIHEQVDRFLIPCYDLVCRSQFDVAKRLVAKLREIYPYSTQIAQFDIALDRGIFHG